MASSSLSLFSTKITRFSNKTNSKKLCPNQSWDKRVSKSNTHITRQIPRLIVNPFQFPSRKVKENGRGWRIKGIDDGSCGIPQEIPRLPPSAADTVREFHVAFNGRDMEKLDQLLSDDCQYEDLIFYVPFEGKEGVKKFLHNVMDAMGPNVQMTTISMTEGEGFTVSVLSHLEWKGREIPFTSACRYFHCKENIDGKLFIEKITALEEFPLKPGDLLLKLLKTFTTFFDLYPIIADGLLSHGSTYSRKP